MDAAKKRKESPSHARHRERLRNRFLKSDLSIIEDYELLELLLFNTHARMDVKPLAKKLLLHFENLPTVLDMTAIEKKQFEKETKCVMSDSNLALFAAVKEIAKRMARTSLKNKDVLTHWDGLLAFCRTHLGHQRHVEFFHALYLDAKGHLIFDECLQKGTVNAVNIYLRDLMRGALLHHASGVIMVHNHPSGKVLPSRQDIDVTRKVALALRQVGLLLIDHVIITSDGDFSFRNDGLLNDAF